MRDRERKRNEAQKPQEDILNAVTSSLIIPEHMRSVLRPHQISALHFVWAKLVDQGFLRVAVQSLSASLEQRLILFQEVYGCIIGHSMGLGKTLTAISFVFLFQSLVLSLLQRSSSTRAAMTEYKDPCSSTAAAVTNSEEVEVLLNRMSPTSDTLPTVLPTPESASPVRYAPAFRVLVVAPKSCVLHWYLTLKRWMIPSFVPDSSIHHMQIYHFVQRTPLTTTLECFYTHGGFLLLSYEEYVMLCETFREGGPRRAATGRVSSVSPTASIQDQLREPVPFISGGSESLTGVPYIEMMECPDILILDEAHRLRRESSKMVSNLRRHSSRIQLRIALTGTPIQNHLNEYNIMQSLVTGCDIEAQKFQKFFIQPIDRGQCVDSTYQQFTEMQECVSAMRRFFGETVHYAGPEVLEQELPPRREFVLFFRLSSAQEKAYEEMLAAFDCRDRADIKSGSGTLRVHHEASHIACHPLLRSSASPLRKAGRKRPRSLPEELEEPEGEGEGEGEEESETDGDDTAPLSPSTSRRTESETSAAALVDLTFDVALSPKLHFAVELVNHIVHNLGEKVILFSMYTRHLELLAAVLLRLRNIKAPIFSGQLSDTERQRLIDSLNRGVHCRALLCSLRAGGVGIDLVAANHCILFDVSWNPADDTQAAFRVYRFGQTRPVTIYRLATAGTTEQVVFAYALQKSWLHKKIADVRDPTRQQRHQTEDYFTYPCALEIHPPPELEGLECAETDKEERRRQRAVLFREWCEKHCPAVAHVLYLAPSVHQSLENIFLHSSLLQDDAGEIIRQMEKRFRFSLEKVKSMDADSAPSAHTKRHKVLTPANLRCGPAGAVRSEATAPLPKEAPSCTSRCDHKLLGKAQRASYRLLSAALRQTTAEAGELEKMEKRMESFSPEDLRTMAAQLTMQLNPLLRFAVLERKRSSPKSSLNARPMVDKEVSPFTEPDNLVEWSLRLYQLGVKVLVEDVLSQPHTSHFRNILSQHIPRGERGIPRCTPVSLQYALEWRPHGLLAALSGEELMYMTTELGVPRPLIPHCFFLGAQCLWRACAETAERIPHVSQLLRLLRRHSEEVGDAGSSLATSRVLAAAAAECMEACLSEEWPAFTGFKKPPIPFDLLQEEVMMRNSMTRAQQLTPTSGALPVLLRKEEVVLALHLAQWPFGVTPGLWACPRCHKAPLQHPCAASSPAIQRREEAKGVARPSSVWCTGENLMCPLCKYNVEFTLRTSDATHHSTVFFQFSVVCNYLDAFSFSKSCRKSFHCCGCPSTLDALRRQEEAVPIFHFMEKCLKDGAAALVTTCSPTTLRMMLTQSGADDPPHLQRLLYANSKLLWAKNIRENLSRRVLAEYRDLIAPSQQFNNASMPFLLLVLGLHVTAREEPFTHAYELLQPPRHHRQFTAETHFFMTSSHRSNMLRFVCDGLVKLLYLEKLIERWGDTPQSSAIAGEVVKDSLDVSLADSTELSLTPDSFSSSLSEEEEVTSLGELRQSPVCAADSRPLREIPCPSTSPVSSAGSDESTFTPCYSSDRSSFSEEPDTDGVRDQGLSLCSLEDALRRRNAANPATATQAESRGLVSEEELELRAAAYWIAWCEVYGTIHAAEMTMMVDEGRFHRAAPRVLHPPSARLWLSQLKKATAEGLTVVSAIQLFIEKVLQLSENVPIF